MRRAHPIPSIPGEQTDPHAHLLVAHGVDGHGQRARLLERHGVRAQKERRELRPARCGDDSLALGRGGQDLEELRAADSRRHVDQRVLRHTLQRRERAVAHLNKCAQTQ